jgi:hypothetical protein
VLEGLLELFEEVDVGAEEIEDGLCSCGDALIDVVLPEGVHDGGIVSSELDFLGPAVEIDWFLWIFVELTQREAYNGRIFLLEFIHPPLVSNLFMVTTAASTPKSSTESFYICWKDVFAI